MKRHWLPILFATGLALAPTGWGVPQAFGFDWLGKVEMDAEGLKSADPQVRLQSVQRLGQYEIVLTKPFLLRALRDNDRKVRAAAGRILGRARVTEALPVVVGWLAEPDIEDKKVAAEILGELGVAEAIPPLIRSLGDLDYEVRLQAVVGLGQVGSEIGRSQVVVPLIGRLEDEKPEVRRAAIEQLMKLGDARAVIPLVGVFGDSSLDVRVAAVTAVGRLPDPAAVPALLRLLDDPAEPVKVAAVTALGNLRAPDAASTLIDQLDTGSNEFRAKVAFALGQIAAAHEREPVARAAVRALVEALANGRLRAAAREALLAAGPISVPALVAHLEGRLDGDPTTAVAILRDLGDTRATPALVDELERGRISRDLVLAALAKSGDSRALVPVLGLLSNQDPAVRKNAMKALGTMIEPGGKSADLLIHALGDSEVDVQVMAARYLGQMRARAAVRELVRLTRDGKDLRVREAAIGALGDIRDRRGTAVLLDILREGPHKLHVAAANALIYLRDPASVKPLLAIVEDASSPSRPTIVRCLGGVLRDQRNREVREHLEELALGDTLRVSLAAITALGAMRDPESAGTLSKLAQAPSIDRKRAALDALGNLGKPDAIPVLLAGLHSTDDRIASAAAWALAKVGASNAVAELLRATHRQGYATPVNSAAAIALLASTANATQVLPLLHHPSRLVRVNAAWAMGRLKLEKGRKILAQMLKEDHSWLVRQAAARALGRLGSARAELEKALTRELRDEVKKAIRQALAAPFSPPARNDWRTFYFVDPASADALVRQEPYFLVAADGLATVLYTDANGEADEERFPAGDYLLEPAERTREY
jgi:HEAT repeat protein